MTAAPTDAVARSTITSGVLYASSSGNKYRLFDAARKIPLEKPVKTNVRLTRSVWWKCLPSDRTNINCIRPAKKMITDSSMYPACANNTVKMKSRMADTTWMTRPVLCRACKMDTICRERAVVNADKPRITKNQSRSSVRTILEWAGVRSRHTLSAPSNADENKLISFSDGCFIRQRIA